MIDIIDVLIAAAALIIAGIQLKNEIKKKRESDKKNKQLGSLVKKISDTLSNGKKILDIYGKVLDNEDTSDEKKRDKRLAIYGASFIVADDLKKYKDDYQSIFELYCGLCRFEQEFSLSYGFGRYIDYFRDMLPKYKASIDLIENSQDIDQKRKELNNLNEIREHMERYISELHYKYADEYEKGAN